MILACLLVSALLSPTSIAPPAVASSDAIAAITEARKAGDVAAIVRAVDRAYAAYTRSEDKKERAKITAAVAPLVRYRDKENRVALHVAAMLGDMGPSSVKPILAALRNKRIEKQEEFLPVRLELIVSLGATKSPKVVSTLLDLLKNRKPDVVIAAAETLSHYHEASDKLRKQITKAMIEALEALENQTNKSQRGSTGVKTVSSRFYEISPSLQESLRQVTGASRNRTVGWREWFNENKGRKWE